MFNCLYFALYKKKIVLVKIFPWLWWVNYLIYCPGCCCCFRRARAVGICGCHRAVSVVLLLLLLLRARLFCSRVHSPCCQVTGHLPICPSAQLPAEHQPLPSHSSFSSTQNSNYRVLVSQEDGYTYLYQSFFFFILSNYNVSNRKFN